ncbi:GRAM domain containing 1A [Phyllostomus discolor]|uniref:GRAM domain containing 1A n=1 Tax=Phyllostomus discolor TaxID=89673 RepID=A0A834DGG4_9CHIR|nr:GRAM domain containing 1A [Phyllostomus discolor]
MAEFLPLLSGVPPLTQGHSQDSVVSPAECQSQQPQDDEPWRLLEVPSIQITPSSDGESPHCTPRPQRLQLLRTSDLDSLLQDSASRPNTSVSQKLHPPLDPPHVLDSALEGGELPARRVSGAEDPFPGHQGRGWQPVPRQLPRQHSDLIKSASVSLSVSP